MNGLKQQPSLEALFRSLAGAVPLRKWFYVFGLEATIFIAPSHIFEYVRWKSQRATNDQLQPPAEATSSQCHNFYCPRITYSNMWNTKPLSAWTSSRYRLYRWFSAMYAQSRSSFRVSAPYKKEFKIMFKNWCTCGEAEGKQRICPLQRAYLKLRKFFMSIPWSFGYTQ